MLNANLVQSTIIYSEQALQQNIIGLDVKVPPNRTKLLDEPNDNLKKDPKMTAYGNAGDPNDTARNQHRRRVSALPDYSPTLPFDPEKAFPGIEDRHIDLLDHCVGKLIQRAGKVDVTWKICEEYPEHNVKIFKQEVDDGTARYQVKFSLPLGVKDTSKMLLKPATSSLHLASRRLKIELAHRWGENFYCLKQSIAAGKGVFQTSFHSKNQTVGPPREATIYWWHLHLQDAIYSTFVSMEPDDPLGYATIDEKSEYIRMTYNPGCGYVLKPGPENSTEISYLVHFKMGGFFPKYLVDKIVAMNLYNNIKGLRLMAKLQS